MLNALDLDPATFRPAGARIRPAEKAALAALGLRWCAKCQTVKAVEEFGWHERQSDGRRSNCFACGRAADVATRDRHRAARSSSDADPHVGPPKRCPRCSRDLPRTAFSRDRSKTGGLQTRCRDCGRAADATARNGYRARWTAPGADPYADPSPKRCPACTQTRPRRDFSTAPGKTDGLKGHCKGCANARAAAREAKKRGNWIEYVSRSVLWDRDHGTSHDHEGPRLRPRRRGPFCVRGVLVYTADPPPP